jgi:hypothetical protein
MPSLMTCLALLCWSTLARAEPAACAPWEGAVRFTVGTQGGRADFTRTFEYDFTTGDLMVRDSDPFAAGSEQPSPRLHSETRRLTQGERLALRSGLRAICPSAEALKRRCAPGGCHRLEVAGPDGVTRVEDWATVTATMKLLKPFFPQLR